MTPLPLLPFILISPPSSSRLGQELAQRHAHRYYNLWAWLAPLIAPPVPIVEEPIEEVLPVEEQEQERDNATVPNISSFAARKRKQIPSRTVTPTDTPYATPSVSDVGVEGWHDAPEGGDESLGASFEDSFGSFSSLSRPDTPNLLLSSSSSEEEEEFAYRPDILQSDILADLIVYTELPFAELFLKHGLKVRVLSPFSFPFLPSSSLPRSPPSPSWRTQPCRPTTAAMFATVGSSKPRACLTLRRAPSSGWISSSSCETASFPPQMDGSAGSV